MASQQFCLKWNNHTNNMLHIFENLLSTETFVDVTLACDGLSLKAHKMVLSACSPFFQSLFLENPCKHPVIIMKDMNYKDLKAIVDFMYHGEVNVSQDQLSALLKTAETLKVKGLAEVSGENRQASGLVQQEVTQPRPNTATNSTPQQPQNVMLQSRAESPPPSGKRKRGRPRKRSLSDSNRSDDDMVPTKIKEPDSPEIEELSGDASMEGTDGRTSSQGPIHSSVNSYPRHARTHVEEPPSGEEGEYEVEPSKLLEQTLTTDNVPAASSTISPASFNLPSSSGMEISQIGASDSNALVPVSGTSDSLSSSHMQGPDSPQDIKPAILTFEDSPISPAQGTSQSMVYMDQSSMPGTSYQDNSLVQHDAQPQDRSLLLTCEIHEPSEDETITSDLFFSAEDPKLPIKIKKEIIEEPETDKKFENLLQKKIKREVEEPEVMITDVVIKEPICLLQTDAVEQVSEKHSVRPNVRRNAVVSLVADKTTKLLPSEQKIRKQNANKNSNLFIETQNFISKKAKTKSSEEPLASVLSSVLAETMDDNSPSLSQRIANPSSLLLPPPTAQEIHSLDIPSTSSRVFGSSDISSTLSRVASSISVSTPSQSKSGKLHKKCPLPKLPVNRLAFAQPTLLKTHHDFIKTNGKFCCDMCSYKANNENYVRKHRQVHFRRLSCQVCTKLFESKKLLEDHMREENHYPPPKLPPSMCPKTSPTSDARYKCRHCSAGFWSSFEAAQHEFFFHKTK